jgi:hypothetical protein
MRLTELRLPLDHSDADLRAAIVKRLGIAADELLAYSVFRRGHDARKRSAVFLTYTLDVTLRDEPAVLARLADDDHVGPTPDTAYRFIARAPSPPPTPRPVVIGTGPAACFAGLLLAQMGFRPIDAGTRQGGARAHQGHLGACGARAAQSGIERAIRRRRRRHLFRRQALQPDQGPGWRGRKVLDRIRQGRRAGRNSVCQQAAYRHLQAGVDGRTPCAPTIEQLGGEIRFGARGRGHRDRRPGRSAACAWPMAKPSPPATSCWRSATAPAIPSACCTRAACMSKPSRFPSACASNIRNR